MDKKLKSYDIDDREWLDNFFCFLNADIESLHETDFIPLLLKYTRFLCHDESIYDFLSLREKYDSYMNGLLERNGPKKLSERKDFFSKLQSHLCSKVDKIIKMVKSNNQKGQEVLVEMKGTRKLIIEPNVNSFLEGFWPSALNPSLNLKDEKYLADLVLADLIQHLKLKPKHFRKCERKRCNRFLYQTTQKEKKYCSDRCATAYRQEKYQASKKQEEKQ